MDGLKVKWIDRIRMDGYIYIFLFKIKGEGAMDPLPPLYTFVYILI